MAEAFCPLCKQIVIRGLSNAKKQTSCGCQRKKLRGESHYFYKHGRKPYSLYVKWIAMRERCRRHNNKCYPHYGGRGIEVCSQWDDFMQFKTWALVNGWKKGLEIDRKNNNGNYEPSNCRFVTRAKNCQNRSNNKLSIENIAKIKTMLQSNIRPTEIAKIFDVSSTMIYKIRNKKSWIK